MYLNFSYQGFAEGGYQYIPLMFAFELASANRRRRMLYPRKKTSLLRDLYCYRSLWKIIGASRPQFIGSRVNELFDESLEKIWADEQARSLMYGTEESRGGTPGRI